MSTTFSAEELKTKLEQLKRPSWKIELHKAAPTELEGIQFTTNFRGAPYLEVGETWPVNAKDHRPLDFAFQIVNKGNFGWPDNIKVIQFFYDWHARPSTWKQAGWLIKSYASVDPKRAQHTQPLDIACTAKFNFEYSLPAYDSLSHVSPRFFKACKELAPHAPWEFYDDLVRHSIGQNEITSFISGYPQWLQMDATPTFSNARSELLVQVDSEAMAYLNWGKHGSIYLFFHPHKLNDYGFVLQSM